MVDRAVKLVYVYPPGRGPGGHHCPWMACWEGEESTYGAQRGWGQTGREAEDDLQRNPKQDQKTFPDRNDPQGLDTGQRPGAND